MRKKRKKAQEKKRREKKNKRREKNNAKKIKTKGRKILYKKLCISSMQHSGPFRGPFGPEEVGEWIKTAQDQEEVDRWPDHRIKSE